MGTNYYWQGKACDRCGRADERIHICKSLCTFQAIFDWSDEQNKYIPKITSWAAWKKFFEDNEGTIVDEYGKTYSVDEFIKDVENVDPKYRRRAYDYTVANPRGYGYVTDSMTLEGAWVDSDEFSFYGYEFS